MTDEESLPVPFEIELAKERVVTAFCAGRLNEWRDACLELKKLLRNHKRSNED